MDRIYLEDLIKFHRIEFKIVYGYYFDEGRNDAIGDFMRYLFNTRLQKKNELNVYIKTDDGEKKLMGTFDYDLDNPSDAKDKANVLMAALSDEYGAEKVEVVKGNPVQQIYKLLMNSFYGKLIQKPIGKDYRWVRGETELWKFISYRRNCVNYWTKIGRDTPQRQLYMIEIKRSTYNHYNMAHLGVEILSMSKRLMNRVMCLAEDLGVECYYQDTDSMHVNHDKLHILVDAFRNMYGTELVGKQLGQFHVDFDDKIKATGETAREVYAVESLFLHKKSYMDKLCLVAPNGDLHYQNHIRMKGIPTKCMTKTGVTEDIFDEMHDEIDTVELYKRMYFGKHHEFNLLDVCKFKVNVNWTTSNNTKFIRKLQFNSTKHVYSPDYDDDINDDEMFNMMDNLDRGKMISMSATCRKSTARKRRRPKDVDSQDFYKFMDYLKEVDEDDMKMEVLEDEETEWEATDNEMEDLTQNNGKSQQAKPSNNNNDWIGGEYIPPNNNHNTNNWHDAFHNNTEWNENDGGIELVWDD